MMRFCVFAVAAGSLALATPAPAAAPTEGEARAVFNRSEAERQLHVQLAALTNQVNLLLLVQPLTNSAAAKRTSALLTAAKAQLAAVGRQATKLEKDQYAVLDKWLGRAVSAARNQNAPGITHVAGFKSQEWGESAVLNLGPHMNAYDDHATVEVRKTPTGALVLTVVAGTEVQRLLSDKASRPAPGGIELTLQADKSPHLREFTPTTRFGRVGAQSAETARRSAGTAPLRVVGGGRH